MKHFWVFTFVSILIAAFFGGFTFPENGYAQNTSLATYLKQGTDIFDQKLKELDAIKTTNPSLSTKLIKSINETKQVFIQNFNNPKPGLTGALTDPKEIYDQSLEAAFYYNFNSERSVFCTNPGTSDTQGCKVIEEFGLLLSKTVDPTAKLGSPDTLDSAQTKATGAITSIKSESDCKSIIDTFLPCLNVGITWIVKSLLLNIVGFFLWMSANLLNYAMYHGIFEFKKFAPDEIYSIWLVVRQIISLFVFFTGLFVGFMAIIGKSEEFKKYIAFMVVFGLFVNFSYPIVRVFIDVSNVVSLQIYQTALGKEVLVDNPSGDNTAGARIMASLGLQGLVASATTLPSQANSNKFLDQVTSLPGALAVLGFVGYAAYIFFMAAVLIIIRTALLVCIIIASPILLVDTIVPALGEKAQWLRGMFVSQLFVAPVFTIMLALTLKFLAIFSSVSGMSGSATSSTLTAGVGASTSSVTVFFNLIMMLVMLHIMLKVTKAVAGGVGETVTKWAGKAGGLGTGLALGAGGAALGFAGRNTIGRFASNMGKRDFGGGWAGNMIKDTFKSAGGAKYDLRNLGATGAIAGTLGITGVGQGAKKSYDDNREEYEKKAFERAGEIEDDGEREKYLNRKFNQNGVGKFVDKYTGGTATNTKAYKNFVKGDEDTVKQYINSNEEGRKKMMEDEKNKKYLQRFETVDKAPTDPNALTKMSAETRKNYDAKLAKDEAQKLRNESRVASYLTADQATRESMIANAKLSDDKELQRQLAAMEKLSNENNHTIGSLDSAKISAEGITDQNLITKILDADQARLNALNKQNAINTATLTAQTNATNLHNAQMAANQAIQNAQNSTVATAQQTSAALNQMIQGNADIAQLLRGIMQNGMVPNNTQAPVNNNAGTNPTPQPQPQVQPQGVPV